MPKGTYEVQKGPEGSSYDSSFRSFLCALLIFLSLCGLIILISNLKYIIGSDKNEKLMEKEIEYIEGYDMYITNTNEKYKESSTHPSTTTNEKVTEKYKESTTHPSTTIKKQFTSTPTDLDYDEDYVYTDEHEVPKPAENSTKPPDFYDIDEHITSRNNFTTNKFPMTTANNILPNENKTTKKFESTFINIFTTRYFYKFPKTTPEYDLSEEYTTEKPEMDEDKNIKNNFTTRIFEQFLTTTREDTFSIKNDMMEESEVEKHEIDEYTTKIPLNNFSMLKSTTEENKNIIASSQIPFNEVDDTTIEGEKISTIQEDKTSEFVTNSYTLFEYEKTRTNLNEEFTSTKKNNFVSETTDNIQFEAEKNLSEIMEYKDLTTKKYVISTTTIQSNSFETEEENSVNRTILEELTTTPTVKYTSTEIVDIFKKLSEVKRERMLVETTTILNENTNESSSFPGEFFYNTIKTENVSEVNEFVNSSKSLFNLPENKSLSESTTVTISELNVRNNLTVDENRSEITESTLLSSESTKPDKVFTKGTRRAIVPETITRTTTEKVEISGERFSPVCSSFKCKSMGSRMLSLMDYSKDPCEDFYAYSCGGMQQNYADSDTSNILLKQTSRINENSSEYLIKYKTFYKNCIDFHYDFDEINRIKTVQNILNEKGFKNFNELNLTDILTLMISLKSLYFLDVGSSVDKDSLKFILRLRLPEESLGEIEPWSALWANQRRCLNEQRNKIYESNLNSTDGIYESYLECRRGHIEFKNLLESALKAFGYEHSINETLEDVKTLQRKYPTQSEIKKDWVNRNYKYYTLEELNNKHPYINWIELFSKLTKTNLSTSTKIQVMDYLTNWLEEIKHYLCKKKFLFHLILTDLYYNFVYKKDVKVEEICLKKSIKMFRDVTSRLYLTNFKSGILLNAEQLVKNMFNQLRRKLMDGVENNLETLPAKNKILMLNPTFSSLENLADDTILNEKYKDVQVKPDFQRFYIEMMEFKMAQLLKTEKFGFGVLSNSFDKHPTVIYEKTVIYIPFGMIGNLPPNKNLILPKIGMALAESIAKHFDPVGASHFTKISSNYYGELIKETDTVFHMIQEKQIPSFKIDLNLTINTRISDNTALRLLTDVYADMKDISELPWSPWEHYSHQKAMFVLMAQEYCENLNPIDFILKIHEDNIPPGSIRLNNMIQNSETFSNVFKCPEGSGMNNNPTRVQFPYFTNEYMTDEENLSYQYV